MSHKRRYTTKIQCPKCKKLISNNCFLRHTNSCVWPKVQKERVAWNKGLTEASDARVAGYCATLRFRYQNGSLIPHQRGRTRDKKICRKISKTRRQRILSGAIVVDTSWKKYKRLSVKNIEGTFFKLHGGYEVQFAYLCNVKKILWFKNTKGFPYWFRGKKRAYFPDFYLAKYDCYVETKGYETTRDHAKWEQFPHRLLILNRADAKDMLAWFKRNLLC